MEGQDVPVYIYIHTNIHTYIYESFRVFGEVGFFNIKKKSEKNLRDESLRIFSLLAFQFSNDS